MRRAFLAGDRSLLSGSGFTVAANTPRRSRLLSGYGAERGERLEEPTNLAWWRPLWGVSARVGAGRGSRGVLDFDPWPAYVPGGES